MLLGKTQKMKSLELFAGAGGLGMAVSLAGFKPVQVVEWDSFCCDTIRANISRGVKAVSNWPLTHDDVRNVDFRVHEDRVHLVTGGPPCQPFSLGGKHRANGDVRDMFPEAVRTVREVRPQAFIFENVKGLTRPAFTNYLEYIRLQMTHPELVQKGDESWEEHHSRLEAHETRGRIRGLHYNVIVHLANAADYGVPQKRERIFFVGFRSDLRVAWSFPCATHSLDSLAWDQYRENTYWEAHKLTWRDRLFSERLRARAWKSETRPTTKPWMTVRDAIGDLPDPELKSGKSKLISNHRYQSGARPYPGHTGSVLDEPAKTLKAGVHGVPGGENMLVRQDGTCRYFTVRESARLQTFPDEFVFGGTWSESMRQLGNAVPVHLAEVVARDVSRALKEKNGSSALQSSRKAKSSTQH